MGESSSPRKSRLRAEPIPDVSPLGFATSRWVVTGLCLAVVLATAAAQWPVLSAGALSFDDYQFLTGNHLVQNPSWASVERFFGEVLHPSTVRGYYLPLSMTSLMLDHALGGRPDNLTPFHATSLLLHLCNTVLILLLLYALFCEPFSAAIVALVFGLHPLTVEPVAWVGERKTLLAAFFCLLSLLLYVHHARKPGWLALVGSVVMYALAMLSKPTAWPLWLVLIVLDYWPLNRLSRRTIIQKWPFAVLALASAGITLLSHEESAGFGHRASLMEVPLQTAYLVSFYAGKILWPVNLSSVYVLPSPMSLLNPVVLAGTAAALGLAVVTIVSLRRTRVLVPGAIIFLLLVVPTLGWVRYSWVTASDKYVYLPAIGLLLPAAWFLAKAMKTPGVGPGMFRVVLVPAVLGIMAAETWATRDYLSQWRTSELLARHMLRLAPNSAEASSLLASALSRAGKRGESLELYAKAIELDPSYPQAHYNYALALAGAGRIEEAIAQYQAAIRLDPRRTEAHNNLANLLARTGQYEAALQCYTRALELSPASPEVHFNLANTLLALNRAGDAIHHFREAARLQPNRPQIYVRLGNALEQAGDLNSAVTSYMKALQINPRYQQARIRLEQIYHAATGTSRPG